MAGVEARQPAVTATDFEHPASDKIGQHGLEGQHLGALWIVADGHDRWRSFYAIRGENHVCESGLSAPA